MTTIRQLNRPPEVYITLIIQNLVLFFHWMQPNTPNFMQYFSAKTKIISLSFTLCLPQVCNFVENVFRKANKTSNLFIFRNVLGGTQPLFIALSTTQEIYSGVTNYKRILVISLALHGRGTGPSEKSKGSIVCLEINYHSLWSLFCDLSL